MAKGTTPAGKKGRRTIVQSVIYWGAVLSVWAAIFAVAFIGFMAIGLPDTCLLYTSPSPRD